MNVTQHQALVIGYTAHPHELSAGEFQGNAQIDGLLVEHHLTICTRPVGVIDLGRNTDGDLVWVSVLHSPTHFTPTHTGSLLSSAPEIREFAASSQNQPHLEDLAGEKQLVHSLIDTLHRHRKKALFALGMGAVVVLCSFFLPQTNEVTSVSPDNKPLTVPETVQPQELEQNPESAAIEFVMNGKVSGVTVPPEVNEDDLSANVVSQSGEIVLVDVQRTTEDGLTTFATLLLQKAESAWRIREVFDPR